MTNTTVVSAGVCVLDVGEGAAQDRVRPALPAADVARAEADLRAVRQGAGRGGAAREAPQAAREEGGFQAAARGGQAARKVRLKLERYRLLYAQCMV